MSADPHPVVELLAASPTLLIVTHEKPDPDAVGSALGLALALESCGKQVQVACADPVPQTLLFLPTAARVTDHPQPASLAVMVDAAHPTRLGSLSSVVARCPQVAVIDHHVAPRSHPPVALLDQSAPAAALLVLEIIRALPASVTTDIATCLYCGLAGDTGFFTYQNTGERAFRAAADLTAAGAQPYDMHRRLSAQLSVPALRLRGKGLAAAQTRSNGRIVYSVLRRADFAETGAREEDTEGIVDLLKSVAGAEVYVLLKQAEGDKWRVSLRSQRLNVAAVAREFGGGGHAVAAGCELFGSEEGVQARVLERVEALLQEGQ